VSIDDEYTRISGIELFESIDPVELKRLIFVSQRYHLNPGEYLFRQGDTSDMVFCVLDGKFSVLLHSGNGEINLSYEVDGDLLGEMAAITGEPRSASIRAETSCEVIGFEKELFISTIINSPQTSLRMMKMLSSRLANLDEHVARLTDS